jgi:phospholipid/cholesterol/gamma-HCH transport system permease protein
MSDGQGMLRRLAGSPGRGLDQLGDQLTFYGKAYGWTFKTISRYKREILHQLGGITFGTGALALVGGSAMVVGFINSTTGAEVVVQGYTETSRLGIEVITGFFSAFVNVRIAVPLIATVALVSTVGAGITAELGAKRISEEIDALEVMAIPPIPFLVTTRIIAGLLTITPLYAIALFVSFGTGRLLTIYLYGVSGGAFSHYFNTFLIPRDVLSSYLIVLAMSVVIVSVHCYYGFNAKGGPAGVGQAVGRSVRLSLILVLFTQFGMSLLLYGNSDTFHLAR